MILLLGDAFLDKYHIGKVRGLSAEAPIPIIDITETREFPGGVENVAANLQALQVPFQIIKTNHLPIKNRLIIEDSQQLARWDEEDWCLSLLFESTEWLQEYDGIVVSDYLKGSITVQIIDQLIASGLPLFVDTKGNPLEWLEAGERVTMFPNLSEYKRYSKEYDWFPKVVLKRSAEGLDWVEYGRTIVGRPAIASRVVCVNGAGDTVLAAWVAAQQIGASIPHSLEFANLAAGIVVEKPFTAVASIEEIRARVNSLAS